MATHDFNIRLEALGDEVVLSFPAARGSRPLQPIVLHPLLAVALHDLAADPDIEKHADRLSEELCQSRPKIREILGDARVCFQAHLDRSREQIFLPHPSMRKRLVERLAGTKQEYTTWDVVFPGDRALFPLTVQWLVTRYCNRHCVYCYQGAIPSAKAQDADLPLSRTREILAEAAHLGAYNFFLTGGEPLLRDDVYDVIACALELGLEPYILTKQFIPEDAIAKLAEAGLRNITLSIDSLAPETAKRMTGVRTFARNIRRTAKRLVDHGIRVAVNTVLATENFDTIPGTLEELDRLGVYFTDIDVYSINLQRHSDKLSPTLEQLETVSGWVRDFVADDAHQMKVRFKYDMLQEQKEEKSKGLEKDHLICANGITTLLFLPDGRVSRCDKRLPGNDFRVGDLRHQSVQEVWGSQHMLDSLKPDRELYQGTLCYDCEKFDDCQKRGRCFYDAYLNSGTLYGPESHCPYLSDAVQPTC